MFASGNAAKQCIKLGSKSNAGKATTRSISITSAKAKLTFNAAPWDDDKTNIKVSVSKGNLTYNNETAPSVTITNMVGKAWTDYTMEISGASEFTITFEGPEKLNRFFLDEFKVTKVEEAVPVEITLDENSDILLRQRRMLMLR